MKRAALMIDIQTPWDYKNPETMRRIEATLPAIREKMEVIWIYMDAEWLCRSPGAAKRGNLPGIFSLASKGHRAQPRKDERVVFKHDCDGFENNALNSYLKGRGIDDLYLGGFMFSDCVLKTALGASLSDYFVTVLHPLCADTRDRLGHDAPEKYQAAGIPLCDMSALEKLSL